MLFQHLLQLEFQIREHFKRGLSLLCQDFLPPPIYLVLAGNKIIEFLILMGAWRCLKKH